MDRVTFTVHHLWSEESIVQRMNRIVTGVDATPGVPYKKDNGNWVLDTGNNWFLSFNAETREATLQGRYAAARPGMMEGLKPFLELVFG